jgi:hypothetical protein
MYLGFSILFVENAALGAFASGVYTAGLYGTVTLTGRSGRINSYRRVQSQDCDEAG